MVSKRGKETVEVLAPNQSRKEKNDTFGKWARNGEELSLKQTAQIERALFRIKVSEVQALSIFTDETRVSGTILRILPCRRFETYVTTYV